MPDPFLVMYYRSFLIVCRIAFLGKQLVGPCERSRASSDNTTTVNNFGENSLLE